MLAVPAAGLDVSDTHVLVSSSSDAKLYDITAAPTLAVSFSQASKPAPVLYGRLMFRAQGQVVEVCSMAGAVTQKLQVAEVCHIC